MERLKHSAVNAIGLIVYGASCAMSAMEVGMGLRFWLGASLPPIVYCFWDVARDWGARVYRHWWVH